MPPKRDPTRSKQPPPEPIPETEVDVVVEPSRRGRGKGKEPESVPVPAPQDNVDKSIEDQRGPRASTEQEMDGDEEAFFAHNDTVRIMVATDTHVGYHERDPVTGDDSFNAWDEILTLAKLKKALSPSVDFILHGGDLFHENKPSRKTLFRCMDSIRAHCFGDDPVRIQLRSDPAKNFPKMQRANYEDPNLNVSIPIFIVHGNHDDPSGDGQLSAIDILSAAGLVNYFGRADDPNDVAIYPLLFQKGQTKVAIYGLGNIRDERLYRTFLMKQVKFVKPMEDDKEWYNMMVIHQNRAQHSAKNHVDEGMLDKFLDLVVWGHEHECQQQVQASAVGFSVLQPGSSVATSLADGEVAPKHAFYLEVRGDKCRVNAIPLRTVRPMAIETLTLSTERSLRDARSMTQDELLKALGAVIRSRLDSMIAKCKERSPNLHPLLRLKIDYTATEIGPMPALRIAQLYADKVANPNDMLQWFSRRLTRAQRAEVDDTAVAVPQGVTREDELVIDELVEQALAAAGGLGFVDQRGMHDSLHKFVDKDEAEAMGSFLQQQIKSAVQALSKLDLDETPDPESIRRRLRALRPPPSSLTEGRERRATSPMRQDDAEAYEEELPAPAPAPAHAARASKTRQPKERSPAKNKRTIIDIEDDISDEAMESAAPPQKRARLATKTAVKDEFDEKGGDEEDAMDIDEQTQPKPVTGKRPRTSSLDKFTVPLPSSRLKTDTGAAPSRSSVVEQLKKEVPSQGSAGQCGSTQSGAPTAPRAQAPLNFSAAKPGTGWKKKSD